MRIRFVVVVAVILMLIGVIALGSEANSLTFETSPLEIISTTGNHQFTVELASSSQQHAQGLQFRKELGAGAGMLFDFRRSSIINMWMKNTLISLDMIFIDQQGLIQRIVQETQPRSLHVISSETPAWAVLEVIAGTSKRLGLKPDDRIKHHIFENSLPQ